MIISKYLILTPCYSRSGNYLNSVNVKVVSSTKGTMAANAVALKLSLDLPEEIFKKPQLQASIKIDKDKIAAPVISADVLHNIKEVLSKQLGVEMNINIVEPAKKTK